MEFLKSVKANFSRRKFFGAIGGLAVLKIFYGKKKDVLRTEKFLSKDGKLVEVDLRHVPRNKNEVTTEQIKNWVHPQKY